MDRGLGDFPDFLPVSLSKRNAGSEVSLYLSVVLSGNMAVWICECKVWYYRYYVGKYDLSVRLRVCG